jgi:tRNA-dihydrouridine synthase
MLMADRFATDAGYRIQALGRGGVRADDHPLIVQFAANVPKDFAAAALEAEKLGADGVDLNLGCPQRRARTAHYGSYLTDPCDWALCCEIVRAAVLVTTIPITVKIRLQESTAETLEFAEMLARAGASVLTLHARRRGREDKRRDGAADLTVVAAIVGRFRELGLDETCAVLSNGNVRCATDVKASLAKTGAAGLMVAEQLLRDPALFARVDHRMERLAGAPKWQCGGAAMALQYALTCERAATGSALFGGGGGGGGGGTPRRRCRLDDGSRPPDCNRRGQRATVKDAERDEFERFSVWWTNHEVVLQHIGQMLGPTDGRVEAQIKRVGTVKAALKVLREWHRNETAAAATATTTATATKE